MVGFLHGRLLHRRPRTFRLAVLASTLPFLALGNSRQLQVRAAVAPELPAARVPTAGDRVLVFAPHPDDEVLGLGGLLHSSRRQGARVQVVYLTSGDGFRLCAAAKYRGWPDQARMRQLASERRSEARAALERLGVGAAGAVFLGYPDRGLASLWLTHWAPNRPFRSPHTAETHVPADSLQPGAPYCGQAALRTVERLLANFRPDFVYYPDPADDHPDHWAASGFVELALERSSIEIRPHRRTYLIHRGQWPAPMRAAPELYLSPPRALSGLDAQWEQAPLTPEAQAAKSRALAEYRSQQALTGGFLSAFIRRNELLAAWPESRGGRPAALVPGMERGGIRPLGLEALMKSPPRGDGAAPAGRHVLLDSTRDRMARASVGALDFAALELDFRSDEVRLSARLRKPPAAWATYFLYWKPTGGNGSELETRTYRIQGYQCTPPGTRFTIDGERLQVSIPRSEIGRTSRIMVAAAVRSGPAQLDRTPWRVVTVR